MARASAALLALLCFGTKTALAEVPAAPSGWSLVWHAPAGCPGERAVQAEVSSLLEGSTRTDVELSVIADAAQATEGFSVELRFTSKEGEGKRVLTGRDCTEVAKAAAMVIALAVDPGVKIRPDRQSALETAPQPNDQATAPEPETAVTPPATPLPTKPKPTAARNRAPRAPGKAVPLSFEGGLGPAVEWGTFPDPAFSAHAAASLGMGAFRATVAGDLFPARTYDTDQSARLRLSALTGSLLLGYAIALGRHALTPELGVRLGDVSASAVDADQPTSANSLLFGPELGVRGTFRLGGPLGLWLGLHGGLNLERPRFVVENRGLVHQPQAAWAAGSLGISLLWP